MGMVMARYGYGGGFSTTTINYDTYVDGTLFIDMIDASKKQLVWQGRGTKTIEPDANQARREEEHQLCGEADFPAISAENLRSST